MWSAYSEIGLLGLDSNMRTTPHFSCFITIQILCFGVGQIYSHMKGHFRLVTIVLSVVLLCLPMAGFAQGKKPTIMILPSDNWCEQRYFLTSFKDQGREITIPDYSTAFKEDTEICAVMSQLGQMMTDLGYSVKDSEQEVKALEISQGEDNVTFSRSGDMLAESSLDILKRKSKADIIVQIGWWTHKENKGRSVSFTIEAFDTYTNKRIATSTGLSKPSQDIVPRILASAVKRQIKTFDEQLSTYFNAMAKNGREISLVVRRWGLWENDLQTEYSGEELIDVIQDWLHKNTVYGMFNLSDFTENHAQFEQVMIPLVNNKGVPMDARMFAGELRKYLSKPPYCIDCKVMMRGLGQSIIILGEK